GRGGGEGAPPGGGGGAAPESRARREARGSDGRGPAGRASAAPGSGGGGDGVGGVPEGRGGGCQGRESSRRYRWAMSASATPWDHPNPSCVGYSPPPARASRSTTSYFSTILPVASYVRRFRASQCSRAASDRSAPP